MCNKQEPNSVLAEISCHKEQVVWLNSESRILVVGYRVDYCIHYIFLIELMFFLLAWSTYRAQHAFIIPPDNPSHAYLTAALIPTTPPNWQCTRILRQSWSCWQYRFRSIFTGYTEATVAAWATSPKYPSLVKFRSSFTKFQLVAEPFVTAASPGRQFRAAHGWSCNG